MRHHPRLSKHLNRFDKHEAEEKITNNNSALFAPPRLCEINIQPSTHRQLRIKNTTHKHRKTLCETLWLIIKIYLIKEIPMLTGIYQTTGS